MKKSKKQPLILMVDLETYGTSVNTVIREICITPFCPKTYTIYDGATVDFYPFTQQQLEDGRSEDAATKAFWITNPKADAAIKERMARRGESAATVASLVSAYFKRMKKKYEVYFVSRGATTFDYPILHNFCQQYGQDLNFPFYRVLDMRSFVKIIELMTGVDIVEKSTISSDSHTADGDCMNQCIQLTTCARMLGQRIPAVRIDDFTEL